MEAYPLLFRPVFRSYVWGGRRLQTVLNKCLPQDDRRYAESWEVVDHGQDQSVVSNGPLQGSTLSELTREHPRWLLGRHSPAARFPLLFKFLDCRRNLSVQVHPNDPQAARQNPPDLGKTEAWVILSSEPGSTLYAGLQSGTDEQSLRRHIDAGTVADVLHPIQPRPGDCVFIPAGTVHALGEGLLVAEIQQASDTTFRLFDWNRVDDQGKSRPLHIEQALAVVDFERGPVNVCQPISTDNPSRERLVECDKFVMDRLKLDRHQSLTIGGDHACHILATLDGSFILNGLEVNGGQTVLLPAALGHVTVESPSPTVLLDMYLP